MTCRGISFASASIAALCFGSVAQAQDAQTPNQSDTRPAKQSGGVEEIVVTALKRAESIQEVPAAITALSGANLQERGIDDIEGLQFAVPSLQSGAVFGSTQITIRGIGPGEPNSSTPSPSTAVYVDGVYQPIPALADLTAIDIDRVEVLRGPQGTLYGRNANGGAVNFISNAPTQQLEGYILGQYESYDEYKLQGMVNLPLTSTIAARAALNYDDRQDGFIKNVVPGQEDLDKGEVFSGRLRIGGQVTENLSFDLNLEGKRADGPFQYFSLRNPIPAAAVALFPALADVTVPLQPWRTSANDPSNTSEYYGLAAFTADWNSSFGDIKSITAYQYYRIAALTDQDATSLSIFPNRTTQLDRTFTEELNLNKKIGPVDGIFGGFYMDETGKRVADYVFPLGYGGLPPGFFASYGKPQQDTQSRALYADLTWHLSDQLRLIGGLRYSDDKQTIRIDQVFGEVIGGVRVPFFAITTCPTPVTKLDFSSTTGKVGAQYDIAQDQTVYATVANGYLAGGLNEINCPSQNTYKPEKITSYELGYKSSHFDDHLIFNVAAFYYDFTDLQVSQLEGLNRFVNNAGKSHVKGVEAETDWVPDSHWSFIFNITYLDARYAQFIAADDLNLAAGNLDLSGNYLNNSPRFSGNLSAAYRTDTYDWGELVFRADAAARSRFYFREENQPLDAQSGYGVLNLSAAWNAPEDGFSVRLFANNVTDTAYIVTLQSVNPFGRYVTYGTPRQVGIEVTKRFF